MIIDKSISLLKGYEYYQSNSLAMGGSYSPYTNHIIWDNFDKLIVQFTLSTRYFFQDIFYHVPIINIVVTEMAGAQKVHYTCSRTYCTVTITLSIDHHGRRRHHSSGSTSHG